MRILFITPAPPWPTRRGYQLRAAGLITELARRHSVAVVAQRWPGQETPRPPAEVAYREVPITAAGAARAFLAAAWRRPLQVALYRQGVFSDVVDAAAEDFAADVVVVMLSRLGDVLDGIRQPVVVDLVDDLALNMRRRAVREPWLAPLWRWEAWRMRRWDRRLIGRAARVTVVSERDRRSLVGDREDLAERVRVVPLGIDPATMAREVPDLAARPPAVLLSGNLGYFPTVEGALWFAREVWPRVRRQVADARWLLAGARPARSLRRLAGRNGIELIAEPEDLTAIRRRARLAIAPLRAGSGVPIKILEAMADGIPVVATEAAVAGLDGLSGEELLLAGDAAAFADAVVHLLGDVASARAMAERARVWLSASHSLGAVAARFEAILIESLTTG